MKEIMYQFTEAELKTLAYELIHELVKFSQSDDLKPVVTQKVDYVSKNLMTIAEISKVIKYSIPGAKLLIKKNGIIHKIGNLYDVQEVIAALPYYRRKNVKPL